VKPLRRDERPVLSSSNIAVASSLPRKVRPNSYQREGGATEAESGRLDYCSGKPPELLAGWLTGIRSRQRPNKTYAGASSGRKTERGTHTHTQRERERESKG
jgi:hypothetical protein